MPKPGILLITLLVLAIALSCPVASSAAGVRLASSGEFKDKDGSIHAWKINGAHTLIWDGQPYIPVGGVFYSKYVCLDQTEENWQADVRALDAIKSSGISDILLKSTDPVTLTKPEAWQKLLSYLDEAGFSYGIDFADGPKPPLTAYIIEPTRYRVQDVGINASFTFDMPDVRSALWLLCTAEGKVLSSGGAAVSGGKVKITATGSAGQNAVLLVYPCRELSAGEDSPVDIWTGFDEYRDRLLGFVSALKFGKGLRFFVDPLSDKMDLSPELEAAVPDSSEYRLEFEAYLTKKYINIGSVNAAWGLTSEVLRSFEEAARLIPLWRGVRGIPVAYDMARGHRYAIDAPRSKIWTDIEAFRSLSAQNYMNTAADLLKRYAADVPVIYNTTKHHRVFANSVSRGGFDGLGVRVYGHGEDLVTGAAGAAYSLTEESARSMWFVVTATQDTEQSGKSSPGYAGSDTMLADLDTIREIGVKGLFVHGLQVLPEDKWRNHSLVQFPEQLRWLKIFKDRFVTADRADYVPTVIYYPNEPMVGAVTSRLGPGAFWIPSLRIGQRIEFGEEFGAYSLPGQAGICVWSRVGDRTVTFPADRDKARVATIYPPGDAAILSVDKKKVVMKLGTTPVVITGLDDLQAFPVEEVEIEIEKLAALVTRAKTAGIKVHAAEEGVKQAKGVLKNGLPNRAYSIAHLSRMALAEEMGTYVWMEGEAAVSHNFSGPAPAVGASSGGYLSLDTSTVPPISPYSAAYPFVATREGAHEVWLALTTPDDGPAAFSYCVDGGTWYPATLSQPASTYSKGFSWFKLGSVQMQRGYHTLQIRVDEPNSAGIYRLGIDVVVLSPIEFKPEGILKP